MILEHPNVFARRCGLSQRAHDFPAGKILRMQYPAMAMATLTPEVVFVLTAGLDPAELSAEPNQFAHCGGAFADDGFDCVAIA